MPNYRMNLIDAGHIWYQDALKEGREAGLAEGRESGVALAKKVFRLSAEGCTEAEIAAETGISPDEVQKILK